MSDVQDLINAAIEKQPSAFKDAFNDAIADKVHSAIESRRVELATTIFNDQEEVSSEETVDVEEEQDGQDA